MSADTLLSRLSGVKRTGPDRHIARCPAHEDRSPSLAVRELDDGRVLVHCFAQCPVDDVLAAVGLDFDALFPEKPLGDHAKKERRPFNPLDVLTCLSTEAMILSVVAADIVRGEMISAADKDRVITAAARIDAARELINAK